ncbi:MAG: hypothetical protein IPM36_18580 [Lewinellaceae bacterium]|nr:hypothetical protein [Lewinellaceae bacterium]
MPRVSLSRKAIFRATVHWNDNNKCTGAHQRQVQWQFFRNKTLVYSTAFASPAAVLPIGANSTYLYLNATNEQIVAVLIGQAVALSEGDQVCVQARVRNCQNEYATSNKLCFDAEIPQSDCACSFVTAFDTDQSGNTANPPDGYLATGGQLVFSNGLFNPEGEDFSAMPLVEDDRLAWVTFDEACSSEFSMAEITGTTGNVPIPGDFTGLPATDFLVFRNGACQRAFSVSGSNLTPSGPASEPSDLWNFVRLDAGGAGSCTLRRITINAAATGTTFNLPAGYSADNSDKWLLFVNDLLQYPSVNYSVSGNQVTLNQAADSDAIWIAAIV